ncbi:MAG: hypothetical protein QGF12_03485 [SAR202 cluster bacterium]|nr:hypothetical protein [SAR202 cluster bacterium]
MEYKKLRWNRFPIRFLAVLALVALPAWVIAACSEAAPVVFPTPVPTATPNPVESELYDSVWEGTFTVYDVATKKDVTKEIILEFMPKKLVGEGAEAKRDEGATLIEGNESWIALQFVRINAETASVKFNIPMYMTKFEGVLEGNQITGTVLEGTAGKGTFEVKANPAKKPQRRETKGSA